jgi:hypothetical protein
MRVISLEKKGTGQWLPLNQLNVEGQMETWPRINDGFSLLQIESMEGLDRPWDTRQEMSISFVRGTDLKSWSGGRDLISRLDILAELQDAFWCDIEDQSDLTVIQETIENISRLKMEAHS